MDIEDFFQTEGFVSVLIALLFGAMIGAERQWRQKSAGLRTNTMVSVGAAAYVLLAQHIFDTSGGDPSRIAAQIVSGIGFIGAGVIMKDGVSVKGLNTAATIWCSAAVGAFCGYGLYQQGLVVTVIVIATHLVLRPVGDRLSELKSYSKRKKVESHYLIEIVCKNEEEHAVRSTIIKKLDKSNDFLLRSMTRNPHYDDFDDVKLKIKISMLQKEETHLESLIGELVRKNNVKYAAWHYMEDADDE